MRAILPFDPIEPGEVDNFVFDFTADAGTARIVSTSWTCALMANPLASDPNPQSRVISASVERTVSIRSPLDGRLRRRHGCFSSARIGGMPDSAAGGVYLLEATAVFDDGRVLKRNSPCPCVVS